MNGFECAVKCVSLDEIHLKEQIKRVVDQNIKETAAQIGELLNLKQTNITSNKDITLYYSGMIAERLPIRYFISTGMVLSGIFTAMFGLGYFGNIHSFGFYVVAQVRIC